MKQKASKDPMMFIKKFENVLLDCYGDHKDPRRKAHLQEIYWFFDMLHLTKSRIWK